MFNFQDLVFLLADLDMVYYAQSVQMIISVPVKTHVHKKY